MHFSYCCFGKPQNTVFYRSRMLLQRSDLLLNVAADCWNRRCVKMVRTLLPEPAFAAPRDRE